MERMIILEADASSPVPRYGAMVRMPLFARARRFVAEHPWAIDCLLATALASSALFVDASDPTLVHTFRERDGIYYGLAAAATLPYYLRRRFPVTVLIVSLWSVVLITWFNFATGTAVLGLFVGTYTIGSWTTGLRKIIALVNVFAALIVVWFTSPPDLDTTGYIFNFVLFGSAWAFGEMIRARRLHTAALEERARFLEQQRDEDLERSAADERVRIARELHDVIAHSLSVIAVQAGAGLEVLDRQPDEARGALTAIQTTSRGALAEIRQLLGVLRESDADRVADRRKLLVPAAGLDDLDRLASELRETGLPVQIHLEGIRNGIPVGVDLTAYRIVQEALTNVLKHAGPVRRTEVFVKYRPDAVDVEIVDDGRGAAVVTRDATTLLNGGHGLVGMRERVSVWGGTLDVGPRPGGGFRVAACLPYGDDL